MEKYIGEIIGGAAVIIAAIIGLFARNRNSNKQIVKKSEHSSIYQANGSITIDDKSENE